MKQLSQNRNNNISMSRNNPATVHHLVDFYNRYPGDLITIFTYVDVHTPVSDLVLQVSLPDCFKLETYRAMPHLEPIITAEDVIWQLAGPLTAGMRYQYQLQARVMPTEQNLKGKSRAVLLDAKQVALAEETVTVAIRARGSYLKHLPAIFEQDDLMGQFLICFESFLKPIESQIDAIFYYLDPKMTPSEFVPWLAAWLDLHVDNYWTDPQLRRLILSAIELHNIQGTKRGLEKYLKIFAGPEAKVEIIEHFARDFTFGKTGLGRGIALGRGNVPHTFTVNLLLPPLDLDHEAERSHREKLRRQAIISIIESQKPAHTAYTLNLKVTSSEPAPLQSSETER